jgi:hypothetical protein
MPATACVWTPICIWTPITSAIISYTDVAIQQQETYVGAFPRAYRRRVIATIAREPTASSTLLAGPGIKNTSCSENRPSSLLAPEYGPGPGGVGPGSGSLYFSRFKTEPPRASCSGQTARCGSVLSRLGYITPIRVPRRIHVQLRPAKGVFPSISMGLNR